MSTSTFFVSRTKIGNSFLRQPWTLLQHTMYRIPYTRERCYVDIYSHIFHVWWRTPSFICISYQTYVHAPTSVRAVFSRHQFSAATNSCSDAKMLPLRRIVEGTFTNAIPLAGWREKKILISSEERQVAYIFRLSTSVYILRVYMCPALVNFWCYA